MILEAAAIFQLTGTSLIQSRSDFQLGNPPKSLLQVFGALRVLAVPRDHLFQPLKYKGWGTGAVFKNQRTFQSLSEHPQMDPNGQEIHGLRFNLREMVFPVLSRRFTSEPSDPAIKAKVAYVENLECFRRVPEGSLMMLMEPPWDWRVRLCMGKAF